MPPESPGFTELARRLAELTRGEEEAPATERSAAVALTLRNVDAGSSDGPEVLLMRRAARATDRWSGQICLPGGRREPQDMSLEETAMRETREEVGIRLDQCAQLVGRMSRVQARARGRIVPMGITPFVFVQREEVRPALGPEAVEAFWFPLRVAHVGELDHVYDYNDTNGRVRHLPSWKFEGRVIWGLTHQMLSALQTHLFASI